MAGSTAKKAATSASKAEGISKDPGASERVPGTVKVFDDSEKRPVGRPKGYPRSGGRKRGTKNKICADVKEMILVRGKPLELLCDVARGVKVRVGPQAGPGKKEYQYPSLQERLGAAKVLLGKIVPDLKHSEIVGKDGAPFIPDTPEGRNDTARRVAWLLSRGGMVPALTDTGNDDGTDDADTGEVLDNFTPPPGPSSNPGPHPHEDNSNSETALLINNVPSGSVSSSPEIFPANSEPDALTNDDGDAEPPEIGMTRTYGTGDFSIRCTGPMRDGLPPMFSLIEQGRGEVKHGGWEAVEKALRRLVGDVLPPFLDTETTEEVREVSRRDQRPFKQGRPVVSRRRRLI